MGSDALMGPSDSGRKSVGVPRPQPRRDDGVGPSGRRVTLLTAEDPFVTRSAASVRALTLGRYLRGQGYTVEFQTSGLGPEEVRESGGFVVRWVPVSPPWQNPIGSFSAFNQPRCLLRLCQDPPDVVVVSDSRAGPAALLLGAMGVRVILDAPAIHEDALLSAGGSGYERFLIRPVERLAFQEPEGVLVASSRDRSRVTEANGSSGPRVAVFPTPASDTDLGGDRDLGDAVLWVGRASGIVNRRALRRLEQSVIPMLLERRPGTRVILAGLGTRAFARIQGVECVEEYPSTDDLYVQARCLVAPLDSETGSSLAIADGLARSVPVVATGEALVGHGDLSFEGQLLGRSDGELVDHVVELCEDKRRATRLGQMGARAYHNRRSPGVVMAPVGDLVRAVSGVSVDPDQKLEALRTLRQRWPRTVDEIISFLEHRPQGWGRAPCGFWGDR